MSISCRTGEVSISCRTGEVGISCRTGEVSISCRTGEVGISCSTHSNIWVNLNISHTCSVVLQVSTFMLTHGSGDCINISNIALGVGEKFRRWSLQRYIPMSFPYYSSPVPLHW